MMKLILKRFVFLLFLPLAIGAASFWLYQYFQDRFTPLPVYEQIGGKAFQLNPEVGDSYSLSLEKDEVALLSFGFTHCPDICPITLLKKAQIIKLLEQTEQLKVKGIFVSLDPARDTPELLSQYTEFFHPEFIGTTGTKKQLDLLTRHYAIGYFINPKDENGNYTIDHSDRFFLIDSGYKTRGIYSTNSLNAEVAKDLKRLLNQS